MKPLKPRTRQAKPNREDEEERREALRTRPAKQFLSPRDAQLRRYRTKG